MISRRRAWLLAVALAWSALCGQVSAEQRRMALIIGNADYDLNHVIDPLATPAPGVQLDLVNPLNDVDAVSRMLGDHYENPVPILNADFDRMSTALTDFAVAVRAADEAADAAGESRPVILVYFAGHGFEFGNENYLVPAGAMLPAPEAMQGPPEITRRRLDGRAIAANELIRLFSDRGDGVTILVFDACRNNPWARRVRGGRTTGVQEGLAQMTPEGSIVIALSAEPGRPASDGPGRALSPFADAFVEFGARRDLSFVDAFSQMVTKVMSDTPERQRPWIVGSPTGRFCLLGCAAIRQIEAERRAFLEAALTGGRGAFEAFVARYPESEYAFAASETLRIMGDGVESVDTSATPTPRPEGCRTSDFIVFFEYDRSSLPVEAREVLRYAANAAQQCAAAAGLRPYVMLTSFATATETGGSGGGAFRAIQRAAFVADALRDEGLEAPVDSIRIEAEPARSLSAEGVREPLSRRLGVTIAYR